MCAVSKDQGAEGHLQGLVVIGIHHPVVNGRYQSPWSLSRNIFITNILTTGIWIAFWYVFQFDGESHMLWYFEYYLFVVDLSFFYFSLMVSIIVLCIIVQCKEIDDLAYLHTYTYST